MRLEKLDIEGLKDIYALDVIRKEFEKAVTEHWRENPPRQRYQKKLLQDLAVLGDEKEKAIDFPQYEKLSGEENLYSIRHPETKKNMRVIYTIVDDNAVILLTAFLEKNAGDYQKAINVARTRMKWLRS